MLLLYQFPDLFGETLSLLIHGKCRLRLHKSILPPPPSDVIVAFSFRFTFLLFYISAGSADHALCVNSWNEFLITTKILVKNMSKRELELNTSPPFVLQNDQVVTLHDTHHNLHNPV